MDGFAFEKEVRRLARILWGDIDGGAFKIGGKEVDGVYENKDIIYIIESTISRSTKKIKFDADKLKKNVLEYRKKFLDKVIRGYIVTLHEVTGDQKEYIRKNYKKYNIDIISYDQMRSMFFDGSEYIRCRNNYRFGSVYNYFNDSYKIDNISFIPVDFYKEDGNIFSWEEFLNQDYKSGFNVCILGEYGSGKSMIMRELYFNLVNKYNSGKNIKVPIYINLRDHVNQTDPAEALMRHSYKIGYEKYINLIKAWRAGFVDILLDGFDELSVESGWGVSLEKIRAYRYNSMKLIRNFIKESNESCSIIICGRNNYFDNINDIKKYLGIEDKFLILSTKDFDHGQLTEYLRVHGLQECVYPEWLPCRPLLVSYILAKNLIPETHSNDSVYKSWNILLDMISDREAQQIDVLDKDSVKQILERLAFEARKTTDGLGRFDLDSMKNIFYDVTKLPFDEKSAQLMLRLPGMASSNKYRSFVDVSIASAASAIHFCNILENMYNYDLYYYKDLLYPIRDVSLMICAEYVEINSFTLKRVESIFEFALKENLDQLSMDLYTVILGVEFPDIGSSLNNITICNGIGGVLDFTEMKGCWSKNVKFYECLFEELYLPHSKADCLPYMENCVVAKLYGVMDKDSIPEKLSIDVQEFSEKLDTNSKIISSDLPIGVRVLLTILRKLFVQPGAGRQESAFYRGALTDEERGIVPEVLRILRKYGYVERLHVGGRKIWKPIRSKSSIAKKIISNPARNGIDVLDECLKIKA